MIITRNKLFHLSYFAFDPGCDKKMIASQTWGQNDRLIVDTNSFFAKSRTLHLLGMARVTLVWAIGNCSQSQRFALVKKYRRRRDKIVLHLLQYSFFRIAGLL